MHQLDVIGQNKLVHHQIRNSLIMPNSKHRKKQLIASRKQLDKARKKIQKSADILPESTEDEFNSKKENRPPSPEIRQQCNKEVDTSLDNDIEGEDVSEEILNEDAGTWFGGLYGWCHSGIAQVSVSVSFAH